MLMIAPVAFVDTDMLAAALPASERAALDMDFTEALVELFPICVSFKNYEFFEVDPEYIIL